jgi:phosphatidylinositol glycan class C protein
MALPFVPLVRSATLPPKLPKLRGRVDRTLLAPEDAYANGSPPRGRREASNGLAGEGEAAQGRGRKKVRDVDRIDSSGRRRKRTWKKLLWVKQSCR